MSWMLALLACAGAMYHATAAEPTADEIAKRSLQAFYYAGSDIRAKIAMKLVSSDGKTREREMTMLRLNVEGGGDQRYYIYFHAPADVKSTSFMVWKYATREDDRWIFIPAVKAVRRIAADDKRSSFVGSDFTYEDVSGRDIGDETHALLRQEALGGRPTYVLESRPKSPADYVRRLSWIDRERWLPLKEEYFNARDEMTRVFTADAVKQVGKHWTVMARTMKNLQTGHRTEVVFQEVEYGLGLTQDIFTERYLRDAPRQWVR
jgi:outer membrane lipoprotein-sorting protein